MNARTIAPADAWLGDHTGTNTTCLCMGMRQWCERGMHKHCACPHRHGHGAEARLQRRDGSPVLRPDHSTWPLWLVPKPCRLHQVCPCPCHRPAQPAPFRLEPAA